MNPAKFSRTSNFSIERFIEEIKKRPALWDIKYNGYGDKNKKMYAWDEVCAIFIRGWQEMGSDERFVKGMRNPTSKPIYQSLLKTGYNLKWEQLYLGFHCSSLQTAACLTSRNGSGYVLRL